MSYTNGLDKPSDYFNTKLYTGDGTSPRSITGVGFQPDWVWTKNRSGTNGHVLYDSVRGVSAGELSTHNSNAEGLATQYGEMTSFDSDGYTFQDGVTNGVVFNNSGNNYVSWNWLASNTTASNTDGSITSTVSANTTSGFSIVSYTGTGSNATVGHGLGVVPKMIIVKYRSGAGDWTVYNSNIGNTNFLRLNGTLASTSQATYWNNTTPTSSVFSVGSAGDVNTSSGTHIAYCFAEKKGFSKFGSYTGNGSNDGTFVYLGFKPAFVIVKRTDAVQSWYLLDNKRNTFNPEDKYFKVDASSAEDTLSFFDFVSNGFKARGTGIGFNSSGGSFIYMAFAESPFVTSSGIPTVAR